MRHGQAAGGPATISYTLEEAFLRIFRGIQEQRILHKINNRHIRTTEKKTQRGLQCPPREYSQDGTAALGWPLAQQEACFEGTLDRSFDEAMQVWARSACGLGSPPAFHLAPSSTEGRWNIR